MPRRAGRPLSADSLDSQTMRDQIELHDSRVAVHLVGDAIVLRLCPAYVHHWERSSAGWRGEGRSQSAEIVITKASSVVPTSTDAIHDVASGWLQVGNQRYENLIPVPLVEQATVRGRLELVNSQPLEVQGKGVTIRLVGEPEIVEELPPGWAPSRDAV